MNVKNNENLPEGWSIAQIENLLQPFEKKRVISQGWSPQCEKEPSQNENDWGVLKTTSIQMGKFLSEHNKRLPNKLSPRPQHEVKEGDILLTCAGPRNRCGVACLVRRTRKRLMISGKMYRFRPNTDSIDPRYLEAYLQSSEAQAAIDVMKTGGNESGLNLTHGRFCELLIPVAPLEQQKRIVAEIEKQFSRLDDAVANLKRVKANLKRYKAAVLKAAVEGKLTEEWRKQHPDIEPASKLLERILTERREKWEEAELAKMKAKGKAPEDDKWKKKYKEPDCPGIVDFIIPQSWSVATVQQLAERVQYGSSSKTNEDESGIPVLRMGNIFEGELTLEKLKYLPPNHNEFPELLIDDDDLLFNRTNSPELVGKTAVYKGKPTPCSFASYLIRVRMMPGVEAKFLSYYINSMHGRQWVKSVVTQQVGQANVNGTKLQALIIPVPPSMEQRAIVSEMENRFSLMNGMEVAVETNMLRAERLRQSILSKAFSGELIRDDSADSPNNDLLSFKITTEAIR